MVCNVAMDSKQIIDNLGGSARLAARLTAAGETSSVQRVDNWKRRGIPEVILLRHARIFRKAQATQPNASQPKEAADA